jgi:GAF domain-containing protein
VTAGGSPDDNPIWKPTRRRVEILSALGRLLVGPDAEMLGRLRQAVAALGDALGEGIVLHRISTDGLWTTPIAVHHPEPTHRSTLAGILGERYPTDEGFTVAALERGQSLVVPRITSEEVRCLQPALMPVFEAIGMQGFAVAPLGAPGHWIGLLWQTRTVAVPALTDDDRLFLDEVGCRFALVMANLRLSERLDERP